MIKTHSSRLHVHLFGILCLLATVSSLDAANISFLGSILRDDDLRVFTIIVDEPTSVRIRSVGYAGDQYSDVGPIAAGGFDTYLTLFDSTGTFVAENDDSDNAIVDPTTGQAFDAEIDANLAPGIFSLWLSQYGNYSLGPSDSFGFSEQGNASYTNDPTFNGGEPCPSGLFKDSSGSDGACRTGEYGLEFLNDEGATAYYTLLGAELIAAPAIPEPTTYSTFLGGLLTALVLKKWIVGQSRRVH